MEHMNRQDKTYGAFALTREMLETVDVVKAFQSESLRQIALPEKCVLLTGEGSSRIFPGKHLAALAAAKAYPQSFLVQGALEACEYDLRDYHVVIASNSGRTAEGVTLARQLRETGGCSAVTAVVGDTAGPIATAADYAVGLQCGTEQAVAATKSVIEQALMYDTLFRHINGREEISYAALAEGIEAALTANVGTQLVEKMAAAPTVYFSGRNNGVAEELTLKTNEITRKKSDFLEGTYAVHGIEEVMQPDEVLIAIDPYPEQEEKLRRVLVEGVGLSIVAVSHRETSFPTVKLPDLGILNPYLQLAAGWNILVEAGLKLGIDLDKPQRARKVGNEYSAD